jgi:nucleotide-binding universal stress UspA family protein
MSGRVGGPTGLQRWLCGSVTEKVLRGACCHVLVVRSPDSEPDRGMSSLSFEGCG